MTIINVNITSPLQRSTSIIIIIIRRCSPTWASSLSSSPTTCPAFQGGATRWWSRWWWWQWWMIQIFLKLIMIMILRRSWREKDSYQFLRCLARVGSSQDQRTMYQVLIIIITMASMVLIMIRDRVFEAKMADNSKQTKNCEVAGPTGHTGVWSILGWISSRLIAVIRSERCAQPAITITINAWEIGGGWEYHFGHNSHFIWLKFT